MAFSTTERRLERFIMTFWEAFAEEADKTIDDFQYFMNTYVTHKVTEVKCQGCGYLNKIDRGLKVKDITSMVARTVTGVVIGASIGSHSGLAIMGQKAIRGTVPMGIIGGALGSGSPIKDAICAKCEKSLNL